MPEPENEKCIRLKIDCPPKKDGGLKAVEDRQREKQDMMNRKYPKQKIIIKSGKIKKEHNIKDKIKCVTYHIYWNSETEGKIEKHIPKQITEGFENKYQYIYHDKEGKEHEICTGDWHKTKEKNIGKKYEAKPTHKKIISDKNVVEGQTRKRVLYENGDIAEYGSNNGKTFWVLYTANSSEIELVKMPDELNYSNSINVKYDFSNTQRRYTSPGSLAGFIGALAENNLKLTTTGSCFVSASCFPSQEHVNGKSIDTLYLDNINEQKFIDAMHKFNFNKQITGKDKKRFNNATPEQRGTLHNSHLHSGFNESSIKEVKK